MFNPILNTDSYKLSHYSQYPMGVTAMQSYLESRGGEYDRIVFNGLYYVLEQLKAPSIKDVLYASDIAKAHGVPFNLEGFTEIATKGAWPVKIIAKKEGAICRSNEPLLTIESTDKNFWATNYLETMLMRVWYPITVASKALEVKKILEKWYKYCEIKPDVLFSYHNFGSRGSSSTESAAIAGAAHLMVFRGTDNLHALELIDKTYINSSDNIGFSIPATEHSTVTSWGREHEYTMMENYLEQSKGQKIIACVSDSYNIFDCVNFVSSKLRSRIESNDYPVWVIRPDSGNPLDVIPSILSILDTNNVSFTLQNGYKLYNKYRILWGDGISPKAIDDILSLVVRLGYSPANFAFGSGGDLCQNVGRDTLNMAVKVCAIKKGNKEWLPVFKDPLHGSKKSKGGYQTVEEGVEYYNNGIIAPSYSFNDIRLF